MANTAVPETNEWRALVDEPAVDPDQPMVDAHHHLWPPGGLLPYGLADLQVDHRRGTSIERTVFIECGAAYRTDGPPELASGRRDARSSPRRPATAAG